MTIDPHTMSTGDVARALGLSAVRIRQLDEQLEPVRIIATRARRYDPRKVEAFAARRAGYQGPHVDSASDLEGQ